MDEIKNDTNTEVSESLNNLPPENVAQKTEENIETQKDLDWEKAEERITNIFHNFKEEPIVIGRLIAINDDKTMIFDIEGKEVTIGSYASLHDVVSIQDIGKMVRIEILGEEMSKNKRKYFKFSVKII